MPVAATPPTPDASSLHLYKGLLLTYSRQRGGWNWTRSITPPSLWLYMGWERMGFSVTPTQLHEAWWEFDCLLPKRGQVGWCLILAAASVGEACLWFP